MHHGARVRRQQDGSRRERASLDLPLEVANGDHHPRVVADPLDLPFVGTRPDHEAVGIEREPDRCGDWPTITTEGSQAQVCGPDKLSRHGAAQGSLSSPRVLSGRPRNPTWPRPGAGAHQA